MLSSNLMKSSICLGSAQFGMNYGITNKNGKVKIKTVKKILDIGAQNGISYIDTAQSYGDSEKIIGMSLPHDHNYSIISKLKKLPKELKDEALYYYLEKSLVDSLNNLRTNSIDALLLHNSSDLFDKNILLLWIKEKIKQKRIKRFGISIYDSNEIKKLPLEEIDLIQLPISLFDQRLIVDGTLQLLNKNNISIHARSIFLQGLILAENQSLPSFLSDSFKTHHRNFSNYCLKKNLKKLDLAIAFIRNVNLIESVLIGIENEHQLFQIIEFWNKYEENQIGETFNKWSTLNPEDIDPRKWPKY